MIHAGGASYLIAGSFVNIQDPKLENSLFVSFRNSCSSVGSNLVVVLAASGVWLFIIHATTQHQTRWYCIRCIPLNNLQDPGIFQRSSRRGRTNLTLAKFCSFLKMMMRGMTTYKRKNISYGSRGLNLVQGGIETII